MKLTLASDLGPPVPPAAEVKLSNSPEFPVVLHDDVLAWLSDAPNGPSLVKKAQFGIRRLMSTGHTPGNKSVVGQPLKGWMRVLLGGNGGSQFYMWYARADTEVGRELELPTRQIAIRAVRHHDDMTPLNPGQLHGDYHELEPADVDHVRTNDNSPYTDNQIRIARAPQSPVITVKGYPGSGKTTSLWLSTIYSGADKALYVTYSPRLADEAERHFRTFRREGTEIEVMTFSDLVIYLLNANMPEEANQWSRAEALHAELASKPNLLKMMGDHGNELFAELHAHAFGRALPVAFKGTEPAVGQLMSGYKADRGPELGPQMASVIQDVAEHIVANGLFDKYFGPLQRAARALESVSAEPPPRLKGCAAILVDEVQDLTQIEAFLLFNICARIGLDSGVMPRVYLAGDESQTVRPTDFKWSWLKDLATTVLGSGARIADETLDSNLRSPEQIALFVEATRNQYALFDKSYKPSGLTRTEFINTVVGQVYYCVAHDDDEFSRLVDVFARTPRSCLVYPGFTPPPSVTRVEGAKDFVLSSEEVKGLDFDLVGIIDAGERQRDLADLLGRKDEDRSVNVFGRTLADQFRVAASRASEKLILIDRDGSDNFELIRDFCANQQGLRIDRVTVPELLLLLESENTSEESIRLLCDETRAFMSNQPERAISRMSTLVGHMLRLDQMGMATPEFLREVRALYGMTLLVGLLSAGQLGTLDRGRVAADARQLMNTVDLGPGYEAVLRWAEADLGVYANSETLQSLAEAVEQLDEVRTGLPEVYRLHVEKILQWHNRMTRSDAPSDLPVMRELIASAQSVENALGGEHQYLAEQSEATRQSWADQLIDRQKFTDAIRLLRMASEPDRGKIGHCLEAQKDFRNASIEYEAVGDFGAAVRCLRMIPDLDAALRTARAGHTDDMEALEWLLQVRTSLQFRSSDQGELTAAEQKLLLDWTRNSLATPEDEEPF